MTLLAAQLYETLTTHLWVTGFVFVMGAILGSFYNVLIYRIPEKTLFKKSRSHCRFCGAQIPFWLNIPLISWFLLRGKTRCCEHPLPFQYPAVEWITALGFGTIYLYTPFIDPQSPQLFLPHEALRFTHNSLFFSMMLICSVIDLRLRIIPNVLTLGLIITSPIWILIHPELDAASSLIGIIFGGGILYTVGVLYMLIRKQMGMGMGDVKFLAGIGGWLGYQVIIPTLFTACIAGSVFGFMAMIITHESMMKKKIPFGPFLAGGALLYHYSGQHILDIILRPFLI